MQTPRKQREEQREGTAGDDYKIPIITADDSQESSVCDSEDAVILTARRVRLVRCCRAKQTTLPSVGTSPVSNIPSCATYGNHKSVSKAEVTWILADQ